MNPGLESCGAAILNGGPEQFQGTSMQDKTTHSLGVSNGNKSVTSDRMKSIYFCLYFIAESLCETRKTNYFSIV